MNATTPLPLIQMNAATRTIARQTVASAFAVLVEAFPAKAASLMRSDISVLPDVAGGGDLPPRCILNLQDPEHVHASASSTSEIHWIATRMPKQLLGSLEDGFQGAWFDGVSHLHFQQGGAVESYGLLPGHSSGYILGLLASIAGARTVGIPHHEVFTALRPLLEIGPTAEPTPKPSYSPATNSVPSLIAA